MSAVRVLRRPRQTIVAALAIAHDCDLITEDEKREALDWMGHPDGCDDDRHDV